MSTASERCTRCGVEYILTRENFYMDSRKHNGFRMPCKRCINKTLPHHPKIIDLNNKKCPVCKIVFPRTDEYFYKNNNHTWDGLAGLCKICHNKNVKKWSDNNPEKVSKAKDDYRKRNKDKVQIKCIVRKLLADFCTAASMSESSCNYTKSGFQ